MPIKINLDGLLMNTTYSYSVLINGKPIMFSYPLQFTTKDLWQWRKPSPDLTFLTGSCAYFNEPLLKTAIQDLTTRFEAQEDAVVRIFIDGSHPVESYQQGAGRGRI